MGGSLGVSCPRPVRVPLPASASRPALSNSRFFLESGMPADAWSTWSRAQLKVTHDLVDTRTFHAAHSTHSRPMPCSMRTIAPQLHTHGHALGHAYRRKATQSQTSGSSPEAKLACPLGEQDDGASPAAGPRLLWLSACRAWSTSPSVGRTCQRESARALPLAVRPPVATLGPFCHPIARLQQRPRASHQRSKSQSRPLPANRALVPAAGPG